MSARKENESFEAYKRRQKIESKKTKLAGKVGRMLWNSTDKGTYVRSKHGPL